MTELIYLDVFLGINFWCSLIAPQYECINVIMFFYRVIEFLLNIIKVWAKDRGGSLNWDLEIGEFRQLLTFYHKMKYIDRKHSITIVCINHECISNFKWGSWGHMLRKKYTHKNIKNIYEKEKNLKTKSKTRLAQWDIFMYVYIHYLGIREQMK